jgi:amino acid adenylation domain-containing protein
MQEKYFPTNQLQSIENTQSFIPLAHGQRALWHLYQMAPKSTALNIYCTVEFSSEFNLTSWRRAWQKIGERHSILRTTYTSCEGQPVQVVDPHREIEIEVTDASNWSEDYLKTQILATADRPFDLEKGSVLRIQLYTRHDKTSVQVLVMHQIAGDMWSFDILLEELQLLYTTEMELLEGDSAKGNDVINKVDLLPWQYTDYVSWQQKTLESAKGKQLWAYWKQELAGELPVLNLPTDRGRPPVQTYEGNSQFIELDEALLEKLRDVGKCEGASLYTLLLATFLVQLYRYTNQEDILVGSAMAGRSAHQEFKKIVGYFSDPVVLRANFSGNPTFKEFLAQIRGTVFRAVRHQDYPFPLLVEQLDANRDLSRPPLFQVAFTWQKHGWYETASNFSDEQDKDLSMKPYSSGIQRGSVLDLNLQIEEAGSSLIANWQYNTDLFDATTVSRMAGHFQTLLEAIVTNPEQCVAQLPLLTEAERNQLLVEWNNTRTEYPLDKCIHQLFEEQVERTPDNVAVVFEDQQLTYRELNARANQLAHYLQKQGVGPDVLVGICVERSLKMIVGLFGILKAGGAYVPLDPAYPQERLTFMLEDAQVPVLLTQKQLLENLPVHQRQTTYLDSDWDVIVRESKENPISKVRAENLAYVIYTSGSTGRPKGAMLDHRGICNRLLWGIEYCRMNEADRILHETPISFDPSVTEIFAPLLVGAQLILASLGKEQDSSYLVKLIAEKRVTHLDLMPSMLQMLLEEKEIKSCDCLKVINCDGEALTLKVQERLFARLNADLYNIYGPTETSVSVTFWLCQRESHKRAVPIGRPISNVQIYLLDRHLQPVPVGIPGELHIGGVAVGRGYFNRPDLTKEKFIPNPFNKEPGVRLYKTGDLVRYLPDGNIEFLGRIDHQVKVRGNRIELGEIESILGQHPNVREVVVTAREDVPGDKRLFAYIVPNQEQATTPRDLRRFLKDKLPHYMMPSALVLLDKLPRTPNGKVDRRALPVPDKARPELEETFVAPRTPVEEVLVGIWAEVLGLDKLGVQDNFFEWGGHSLLATQVISRVRDAFSVELSLYSLFEAPTISSLGEKIEAARREGLGLQAPPILPRTINENLPLSFAQQRLWFLDQLMPDAPIYNILLAYRVTGQLNVAALEQSLGEIVRRHEALRTTFTAVDGQPIQAITPEINLRLTVVDLQEIDETEREEEVQRLATQEAQQPFDLTTEPLLRVQLLRLDEAEHVLLLTMHHIVSDGWSLGVLMRELAVLYEAFSTGKPASLPELPIQYADFALWQREWLSEEVLESQLGYWKQQLGGELPVLELPTDRPRPPVQTYRGAKQSFELSKDLTDALKALSRREGVTLFMTLLAAFKTLLYRYTVQEDVIVGSPIANRNWAEIEGLIGFFVNTLVLRSDLGGTPSFRELLGRVREVALGAYAHQDMPFERLVEELQPERDMSYNPLFQVMFVLQNTPMPDGDFSGLALSSLEVESKTARFDLALSLTETEQGLIGSFGYNTDLFDEATIARMVGHLRTLLEGVVADPNKRICDLLILTEAERHQLLVEWNDTQVNYPLDKCIHQLFEEQAERTPDNVAVVFEDQQLTYRELNARANQLAHYLQKQGVGPDVLVGICVERSLKMIVGLFGILKAGGAYVPLDPAYPQERLTFMLEDAQVPVLLTQKQLLENLPVHQRQTTYLDSDWDVIVRESKENPISKVRAENLAYVIYTSGSTGRPKGAMLDHRGICNRLLWGIEYCRMNEADRILHETPISFDPSVTEIFAPLLVGAQLILASLGKEQDSSYLVKLIAEKRVTHLDLMPSMLQMLLEEKEIKSCDCLKVINCDGEALTLKVQERLFARLNADLYNIYGPTETSVSVTFWLCQRESHKRAVPIGRPISNVQIYLLDRHLQPVPVGIPGELHIGGVAVGRGYFNRPDLTKEKFIPNPFSNDPKAYLYKTGDLTCYLPDGNIKFLGRIDHQVKIRGARVELEEIEATLGQHSAVQGTVVIVHEDKSDNKRLVAYVVPNPKQALTIDELRCFLKQKLPSYMVPSTFVLLDALQLMPNGKVDRRALPAPDQSRPDLKKTFLPPRTPFEQQLADIWVEVLKLKQVGISDNFFDLGGHSLLAIQVISRLRNALKIELPLYTLFELPTIAEIAKRLETVCLVIPELQSPMDKTIDNYQEGEV